MNNAWALDLERGVLMKKENRSSVDHPIIAEGINTEDELNKDASEEEVAKGDYTKVVTLSLDENDPS